MKKTKNKMIDKKKTNRKRRLTIIFILLLSLIGPLAFRLARGTYAPGRETYIEALSIKNNKILATNIVERVSLRLLTRVKVNPIKALIFVKVILILLFFILFEQSTGELFKKHKEIPIFILILSPLFINLIQASLAELIMINLFIASLFLLLKNKTVLSAFSSTALSIMGISGALYSLSIMTVLILKEIKKNKEKSKNSNKEENQKNNWSKLKIIFFALLTIVNLIILYYNIKTGNVIPSEKWNLLFELNGGAISIVIVLLGILGIKFLNEDMKGLTVLVLSTSIIKTNIPILTIILIVSSARAVVWMEKRKWHLKGLKEVSLGLIILVIISEGIASGIITATAEPNYQEIKIFKQIKGVKGGVLTDPHYEVWLNYFGNKRVTLNKSEYNKLMESSDVKSILETMNSKNIRKILISNSMKINLWGGEQKRFYFIITHNEAFEKEKTNNKYFEIWDVNLTKARKESTSFLP